MATLQTQSAKGIPLTVVYPAEKPNGYGVAVPLRVGKKTVLPAFGASRHPHLVQFRAGQRTVMFMLSDLLEKSYWQKIRNAYTLFGELDVDKDLKIENQEAKRIAQWLKEQSAELGVTVAANG
jgi:hypothetical protein